MLLQITNHDLGQSLFLCNILSFFFVTFLIVRVNFNLFVVLRSCNYPNQPVVYPQAHFITTKILVITGVTLSFHILIKDANFTRVLKKHIPYTKLATSHYWQIVPLILLALKTNAPKNKSLRKTSILCDVENRISGVIRTTDPWMNNGSKTTTSTFLITC